MRLRLDTVANAEADVGGGRSRVSRGFAVLDLDTTNPAEVLLRAVAMTGMPRRLDMLSPAYPSYKLQRYALRAIRGKIALGRLIYETPPGPEGSLDETFSAEDVTTLSTGTTQLQPVTMEELRISFASTGTTADLDAGETATVNFPVPLRSLVLSGLFSSPPDYVLLQAIRHVNDATWMGFPRGYWLYTGIRVQFDNSSQKYAVTATLTSKCEEDWSTYVAVRNPADGKFARVPLSLTNTLKAQQYEFGIRNQKSGLLKTGLYRAANFPAIFGPILNRQ